MKFGFVTCVELGLSCMEAIYDIGGTLDLAITLNDEQAQKKSGRVYLDNFCLTRNIPLFKTSHINNQDAIEVIKKHNIDWLFIIGWSQIANTSILEAPNKGVLGIHPTLLPEGRGRAAIPWAIIKNLRKTGVTLFKLDEGVDTGEIVDQFEIPLGKDMDATKLYSEVSQAHKTLIKKTYPALANGTITLRAQDETLATEWPERKPEDGKIDLQGSVKDAEKLVRALTHPYPGAFFLKDKRKYIIWKASIENTGDDSNFEIEFKDGTLMCLDWNIENDI